MSDEIKLPPLAEPDYALDAYSSASMLDYARLAVEQDRARREGREPHKEVLKLFADGGLAYIGDASRHLLHTITIRWTPERVWIESERNRALAQRLRNHYYDSELALDVADALDGGEQ